MRNFELKINDGSSTHSFGRQDLQPMDYEHGELPQMEFKFERRIVVAPVVDIKYTIEILRSVRDNVDITYAQYPTWGFTKALHFSPDYDYDYSWFRFFDKAQEDFPCASLIQTASNGLVVTVNEWLLPGNGVCLTWHKKPC